ncbi:iron complex transport system permease protein [Paenibacillus endophyticus]|uniref:Iron complex transport system permease protein n=1 Tax=Paenibacillus endophyticus TaxID=1294268 RepID=A0A7W5C3S6_9BACL|nr:iron ABC transporter permease [Paenibacillus endophyticus]MBB3150676.1 iron complex transport system permease protein [Paenibacillus endophyticus]
MKHSVAGTGRRARRFHLKTVRAALLLGAAAILVLIASLAFGEQLIKPAEVWGALLGKGNPDHVLIVQSLRAPRVIVAFLVGASLAVAGAILQSVIRNPLAAPDVVGITGGASVGAVAFITYMPSAVSIHFLPFAAVLGAFGAALLIYFIAWKNGVNPFRLVLVGIGIASLLSAITTFMLVFSPAYSASSSYIWLTGTVYGSTWSYVWNLLPWSIVLLGILYFYTRQLNMQLLGDELAIGLGSRVQRHRFILILISVGLAGSAVSIGGVIGFVGLIAPHAARRMVGPMVSRLIPISALFGGIIVALADLIARTAFLPLDIPVGVFTSGIGAPFFIYLLYRTRNNR